MAINIIGIALTVIGLVYQVWYNNRARLIRGPAHVVIVVLCTNQYTHPGGCT